MTPFVNAHTHRFGGDGIEMRGMGVHPWHADHEDPAALDWRGEYDYVGETGLDYACHVPREAQMGVFQRQLAIAQELQKPVVLHCVRAFSDCMAELAKHDLKGVVFHGFMGSVEQMRQLCSKGYYASFGDNTRRSPRKAEASLREIPCESLLLETDDSPITIAEIYAYAAEVRGVTMETLKTQIYKNYGSLAGTN